MRFGLFVPQGWRLDLVGVPPEQHWGVMAGLARAADASEAWESIWVHDHFHTVPEVTEEATHEGWSLLSALAAVTGRVRLGQMSSCVGYRNPVLLAKMATTVDIISEGRLDVGLDAGWYESEWLAYGYGLPRGGERLGMMREAAEIVRQAWTLGEVTFDGEHYLAERAQVRPRPLQGTSVPGSVRNGIPLWINGSGENKTLRLVAEAADYANFQSTVDEFEHKSAVLDEHCRAVGRDPNEVVRAANFTVVIGADENEVEERLAAAYDRLLQGGVSEQQAEAQIAALRNEPLVGTPEQICAELDYLRSLGLGYAIVHLPLLAFDPRGLELVERSVIPEFAATGRRRRR